MPIGIPELLIVLAIVLLIFGPKRLPGLGRSLGGGIRNFKDSIRGESDRPDLTEGPNKATRGDDEALDGEVVPDRRP
jgi:sec-independent protein translocase protein TatA